MTTKDLIEQHLSTGKSQSDIARELGISRQAVHQYTTRARMHKEGARCRSCKDLLTKDNRSAGLSYSRVLCKHCLNVMQIKNKYRQQPIAELERLRNKWSKLLNLVEEVLSERVGDGH